MACVEIDGLERILRRVDIMQRQFKSGVATGLNRTITAIEQNELVEMEASLDRVTPFTVNAFKILRANSRHLDATLYAQMSQEIYLKYAVFGGIVPKTITPIIRNITLNQYGNITGKRFGLIGIAGRAKNKFVADINGIYGVWQRFGTGRRKLKLLAMADQNVYRNKRYKFYETGIRVGLQRIANDVLNAIRNVIEASNG